MNRLLPLLTALLLAGCADYPRDVEGTLGRVHAERVFRVGLIAGTPATGQLQGFLAALARESGARPRLESGAAEILFPRLAEGGLDLVVGELGEDTPWMSEVAIIEPLGADAPIALRPAARNGENQWIMLVERVVRDQRSIQ